MESKSVVTGHYHQVADRCAACVHRTPAPWGGSYYLLSPTVYLLLATHYARLPLGASGEQPAAAGAARFAWRARSAHLASEG